ncbi:bacillithiol system redox-active protein YtxJ [Halobacillus seohaensis]|uniref:Bacillithiol system redox-active protein YtxJ n=1 Tax=Halobacillus seohaensis TaxID=447421 RepID=A0ABW2EJE1_9BACI
MVNLINNVDDFDEVLKRETAFFLLKHSLTCPISATAKEQYDEFSEKSDIPCFTLYVQDSRELSHYIAENYKVRHESPQALLFQNNRVKWHDSHSKIKVSNLKDATNK